MGSLCVRVCMFPQKEKTVDEAIDIKIQHLTLCYLHIYVAHNTALILNSTNLSTFLIVFSFVFFISFFLDVCCFWRIHFARSMRKRCIYDSRAERKNTENMMGGTKYEHENVLAKQQSVQRKKKQHTLR